MGESINQSLWFIYGMDIDGQKDSLKERCGFSKDVNEKAFWDNYIQEKLDAGEDIEFGVSSFCPWQTSFGDKPEECCI